MAGYQTVAQRNLTCAIRIRERRRQFRLTQAEVVDRVNGQGSRLSNQALSTIENGRRLAVGRLPDLAAALECTVSYLLGLTADPDRWTPDNPAAQTSAPTSPRPERNAPGTNGSPGGATPPRRSWILGPDLPDGSSLADPVSPETVNVAPDQEGRTGPGGPPRAGAWSGPLRLRLLPGAGIKHALDVRIRREVTGEADARISGQHDGPVGGVADIP